MYLNGTIIYKFHWYIQTPLLLLVSIFLIIYALSETPYFKKLFMGKNIHAETVSPKTIDAVAERITDKFYTEKIFTDTELNLDKTIINLDVSKKDLGVYLSYKGFENFSEFINTLRVNEFKRLVEDEENSKYDLISIAFMAGFKSKATFYRVFKQIEGITPKQFLRTK